MKCTSTNGNKALYKVSSLSDQSIFKGGEMNISYFILSTLGSITTQRKVIESSCPENMHICK
jgi:hypothetical protein